MKYFPFKTVLFCIFVIPVLYTMTLMGVERGLCHLYGARIEALIPSTAFVSSENGVRLDPTVRDRLDTLIASTPLLDRLRLFPGISVRGRGGEFIYLYQMADSFQKSSSHRQIHPPPPGTEPSQSVTRHGVRAEGPSHLETEAASSGDTVAVIFPMCHNTLVPNLVLLLYMFGSCLLFLFFYRRGTLKAERDEKRRVEEIKKLRSDERCHIEKLEQLKVERRLLADQLNEVKSDFQEKSRRASITEEELFDEIADLEKKLDGNRSDQLEKEFEIADLKEQLEKLERRKGGGKKRKSTEVLKKRLAVLYKNVDMNRRALSGLMELGDEMQIKAEEVIHQLNADPTAVTVKRKVFAGKKNKTASFEVLFSYNGRLYFRNLDGNRIEVLVIGTKNSQDKDMEFLHEV